MAPRSTLLHQVVQAQVDGRLGSASAASCCAEQRAALVCACFRLCVRGCLGLDSGYCSRGRVLTSYPQLSRHHSGHHPWHHPWHHSRHHARNHACHHAGHDTGYHAGHHAWCGRCDARHGRTHRFRPCEVSLWPAHSQRSAVQHKAVELEPGSRRFRRHKLHEAELAIRIQLHLPQRRRSTAKIGFHSGRLNAAECCVDGKWHA